MNKWMIGGIIGGVILLVAIGFGVTAAGVAGEASRVHDLMEKDMTAKPTLDEVKKQLADEHYEVTGDLPTINATGPNHSMIVYQTHLTLRIEFNSEGKMNGYHLDRV